MKPEPIHVSRRSFIAQFAALSGTLGFSPHLAMTMYSNSDASGVPPGGRPQPDRGTVSPFTIGVPQATLDDLHERLNRTRWPSAAPVGGWSQGTNIAYLRSLIDYWRDGFDWRRQERRMNNLPQFCTEIDGVRIHFLHIRGRGPNPMPLILTHGWPSTFDEFSRLIPMLTNPGSDSEISFDVVVPSLPGFGFSTPLPPPGPQSIRIASLWAKLMTERLGYKRFCAHGGDIGAGVTNRLAQNHAAVLYGVHVMSLFPPWLGTGSPPLTASESRYRGILNAWGEEEGAYEHLQNTRPQTLAYAMHDSPAGMAAWIVEKLHNWSDCGGNIETRFSKDEVLSGLTLYWATETFASSVRLYYDSVHTPTTIGPATKVDSPTAIALTTELVNKAPREWAERTYTNIQHWTEFPRGGHFMAHEEPELLAADLLSFFGRF
jgi:pimeloyl-ACP methyl ester carboxylesterase